MYEIDQIYHAHGMYFGKVHIGIPRDDIETDDDLKFSDTVTVDVRVTGGAEEAFSVVADKMRRAAANAIEQALNALK